MRAPRNAVALAAFNALRGAAVGGFQALLPMYMASLGYSMKSIGGSVALASLAVALFLPAVGLLIDAVGSRPVILAAGALLAAAPLLAASTSSLILLAAAYALFLSSFFAGQPARMAFLARSVDEARLGSYVGLTSMVFSASRLVGPAAAGYAAGAVGYKPTFLGLTLLSAAGLVVFHLLSTRPPGEAPSRGRLRLGEAYRRALRPDPALAAVLAFVAVDRIGWGLWFPTLTAYLYKRGFTEAEAGLVSSAIGASNTLLLPITGRAVDALGAWLGVAASEALGSAAVWALSQAYTLGDALLAAALVGASISMWIPSYNTLVARVVPRERLGEAYSSANSVRAIAGAPAPYLGGLLYDAVSPGAPFLLSTAILASASLLAVTTLRRAEESNAWRRARRPSGGDAELRSRGYSGRRRTG